MQCRIHGCTSKNMGTGVKTHLDHTTSSAASSIRRGLPPCQPLSLSAPPLSHVAYLNRPVPPLLMYQLAHLLGLNCNPSLPPQLCTVQISASERNIPKVVAHVLPLLNQLMRRHAGGVIVLTRCCQIFSNLAKREEMQERLGKEGLLVAVLRMITHFPAGKDVLVIACMTLEKFIINHPANQTRVAEVPLSRRWMCSYPRQPLHLGAFVAGGRGGCTSGCTSRPCAAAAPQTAVQLRGWSRGQQTWRFPSASSVFDCHSPAAPQGSEAMGYRASTCSAQRVDRPAGVRSASPCAGGRTLAGEVQPHAPARGCGRAKCADFLPRAPLPPHKSVVPVAVASAGACGGVREGFLNKASPSHAKWPKTMGCTLQGRLVASPILHMVQASEEAHLGRVRAAETARLRRVWAAKKPRWACSSRSPAQRPALFPCPSVPSG